MRCYFLVIGFVLLFSLSANAKTPEELIDELVKVSEPGVGYGQWFSGSGFLPYPDTELVVNGILGAMNRESSEPLRELVEKGMEAVPALLEHLDDPRPLAIPAFKAGGMMWLAFPDGYDVNERVTNRKPMGVNLGWKVDTEEETYRLKVGDLCFVALGQIVNRKFEASRYQPTGGTLISSPVRSERLRIQIKKDWGNLSRDTHRQSLVDDFRRPDDGDRQIGAYLRLAFYYPEEVRPLVLEELAKPTFDEKVVSEFVDETLQETGTPEARRQAVAALAERNSPAYRDAVRYWLFRNLSQVEFEEEHQKPEDRTIFKVSPRQLLMELFDFPATVRASDAPPLECPSLRGRAVFVRSLIRESDPEIGNAVEKLFVESSEHPDLGPACLHCLANRHRVERLTSEIQKIDAEAVEPQPTAVAKLEAIASSLEPRVRESLKAFLLRTTNEAYFMAALPSSSDEDRVEILARMKVILERLPPSTTQGQNILALIDEKYPEEAEAIMKGFIVNRDEMRLNTICEVLWYGRPLSKTMLPPLLDDTRPLEGFLDGITVRDRAAQALSHATEEIRYDSDWSAEEKETAIRKLKAWAAK